MNEVLKWASETFSNQPGRKFACSNQNVVCAVITQHEDKAFHWMDHMVATRFVRRQDYMECEITDSDGLPQLWVWSRAINAGNCRGYRFYEVVIDNSIDDDVLIEAILPCCSLYCHSFVLF